MPVSSLYLTVRFHWHNLFINVRICHNAYVCKIKLHVAFSYIGWRWRHFNDFSMFTVAKAILEVLTVLQELNVIRSALLLLCLELQQ